MTVTLSPVAPRYAVAHADDPFKKYWWAILIGIVLTGLWLLTPMLGEKAVGSTAYQAGGNSGDANVEQSLLPDAVGGTDLSMDGTGKRRKEDGFLGSSLYQAPPEDPAVAAAAAPGSASGSVSGGTLADALKKVSEGTGGWGEKAQRGFNAPKLSGSSLSGMGAASGGSAGSASGSSAFGTSNANIGFANTSGLSGRGSDLETAPNTKGVAALKAASAQASAAASNSSNDGARSAMSQAFDGAKGGKPIGGNLGPAGGSYVALDAAPVNLKLSDPKLNEKKLEAPPASDLGESQSDDATLLGQQIAMQVAGAVLGAAIGGPVGGVVTSVIMQAAQRQMDQQAKVRQLEEQKQENDRRRRLGLPVQQQPS